MSTESFDKYFKINNKKEFDSFLEAIENNKPIKINRNLINQIKENLGIEKIQQLFKNENVILNYVKNEIETKYEGKLLLLTKSGSQLYGTNLPSSDTDYLGVFVGGIKVKLGFNNVEEINLSITDKDIDGKNTDNAIDIKLYELKKFLKLTMDNNPNIIELLFVHTNKDAIIYHSSEFEYFEDNTELFINKRVYDKFTGYAFSQFKKGILKATHYKELQNILNIIKDYDDEEILGVVVEKEPRLQKYNINKKYISIPDINYNIQKNIMIKKAIRMIERTLHYSSHRKKDWEEFGYDTKFFMHTIRLLDEGIELIKNKKLVFPLKNREYLLKIRKGQFSLEELQQIVDNKFTEIRQLENNVNQLPSKAKIKQIEKIMLDIYLNFMRRN
jgi:hypothetical protein